MASFGKLLRQFRKDANLTQTQLAKKINRSRGTIAAWETEKYLPTERDDVLALEAILDLYPKDLDRLLLAAQMPLKYNTSEAELGISQFDVIKTERLIVQDRLEMTPKRPPAPLRTRIPNPKSKKFVGRTGEFDWLRRRLKAGDVAAIAGVRGIGGIGKTELAIAAANELNQHFANHVIWLDCGPNDAFAIQERLAAALGIVLESDNLHIRADALELAWQRQPATLVVLDDLRRRHLSDFEFIRSPYPPCALLVTSRRYDLPLPAAAIKALDVLSPAQSVELLRSLLPERWLTTEAQAVNDVAALLDHIPLALTLAARRAGRIAGRQDDSAKTPLATLLAELQTRRIQVLDQGADPNRPDLSIVITFDISYDDLDAEDQARLLRLGVFALNEFSSQALQAVWEVDQALAQQTLHQLVDAGLIKETAADMWQMHDLLREYAASRLTDPTELQTTRLAHAAHCEAFLDHLEVGTDDYWRALELHRPEAEQAADWLLSEGQPDSELAIELAITISQTYQSYTFPNWKTWLSAGLRVAAAREQRNSARRLQRSLGEYYWQRGQIAKAEQLMRTSLATAQELLQAASSDDETEAGQRGIAGTQSSLAALLSTRGQYDDAERLYRESLKVFEALGDSRSVAVTQSSLADLLKNRGQYDDAERLYRSGLEICQTIRDPQGVAVFQMGLGQLALARGQREAAIPWLQQARKGFEALNLSNWVEQVDQLLSGAQRQGLTLADLLALVRAAQQGDTQAGEQAWQICGKLSRSNDGTEASLGRGLQQILAGVPPQTALANLPNDLQHHILEELSAQK